MFPPIFANSDVQAQLVAVKTLDSCVSHRVDFIKMDVEGSEPLVLKGAERIITQDKPIILIEINSENLLRTTGMAPMEFVNFVLDLDYRLHEILPDGSCGKPIVEAQLVRPQSVLNVAMLPRDRADAASS